MESDGEGGGRGARGGGVSRADVVCKYIKEWLITFPRFERAIIKNAISRRRWMLVNRLPNNFPDLSRRFTLTAVCFKSEF